MCFLKVSPTLSALGLFGLLDGVCTEHSFIKTLINTIRPTTNIMKAYQ